MNAAGARPDDTGSVETLVAHSKFLSLVLRHRPEAIGLNLDPQGWAQLDELIRLANAHGRSLDHATIVGIVAASDKQRFAMSADGRRIRANQGHSVAVDLKLAALPPPDLLFHGTADRFVASIRAQGLLPQARQHVHLSADVATATAVGARHGRPVVLTVQAARMQRDGHVFHCSANGVWLTAAVPAEYLDVPT